MVAVKFEVSRTLDKKKSTFYYFIRNGDMDIVWTNVLVFVIGHLAFAYALYVIFTEVPAFTFFYAYVLMNIIAWGITGGAHRLWAHRSYEAKFPLRILYMIGQTLAGQNSIHTWARDHRVHHKWSDTDGDPHNTCRGFFFAHCGWLMRKKHPEVRAKAETLDFGDLDTDAVVRFQKNHYWILYLFISLLIPVTIPVLLWGETWRTSFLLSYVLRYIVTLHGTWFVNSAAHMFGDRPYNGKIAPAENPWVSFIAFGEGYHNYHHQFPFDYQASEDGHGFNVTRHFIDFMARFGQAYNLRTMSRTVVSKAKERNVKVGRPCKG